MIVKSLEERRVLYAGVPETMHGSSSYRGGIQVKGAGPIDRRMVLDLRSGSQEKSCGVGLRGFESHPPHHTSQIFKTYEEKSRKAGCDSNPKADALVAHRTW